MSTSHENIQLQAQVPENLLGKRLDQALAEMFPDYSRSRIKEWILADNVKVDGQISNKPREKLIGDELIEIDALIEDQDLQMTVTSPDLDILYQDNFMLAIHKPAGLLVHKSPIDKYETRYAMKILRNQIGHWVYPVHRLDKPTSGILLFAFPKMIVKWITLFNIKFVQVLYVLLFFIGLFLLNEAYGIVLQ